MHSGHIVLTSAAIAAAAALLAPLAHAQSAPTRVVALTGTDGPLGPGLGPGVTFESLWGYGLDGAGRMVFKAALSNAAAPGVYAYAIMLDDESGRHVIETTNDSTHAGIDIHGFDDNGILIERTPWSPKEPIQPHSIWRRANDGAMTLICQEGVAMEGAPPGVVLADAQVTANLKGETLITGDLFDPATYSTIRDAGLWRWTPSALEPLIVTGQALSAGGLTGTVNSVRRGYFNDDGRLFVQVELQTSTIGVRNLLLERSGDTYEAIVVEGDPVSDGSGAYYRSAGVLPNSDGDQLLIGAILGGLNAGITYSVSRYVDGELSLIARSRDPAPGLGGPWFINFGPSTNRHDEVVMTTSISHQTGDAGWHRVLWRVLPNNSMDLLLRNGDPLPLIPGDHRIIQFGGAGIGEAGDISLSAQVGDGVRQPYWGGWLRESSGRIGLLVRGQQPLEISPSDVRFAVQASVYLQGDAGVGSARFEDGSDAIIEVQRNIPCPGDANADDAADLADVSLVIDAFNKAYTEPGYSYPADLNRDGRVDFTDLNLVLAHFNQSCR